MDEVGDSSNKWAEDVYWSHFQFIHFYQTLAGGCEQQLVIPNKFWSNLKNKLPSWDVTLSTNDDELHFKGGWPEFVKAHSLELNDLLVFRYNGASQFDVLIFDWNSFCEKETSYFVKMCEHIKTDSGYQAKRKFTEPCLDGFDANTNNGAECASSEYIITDDNIERMIQDVGSKDTNFSVQPEASPAEPIRRMQIRGQKTPNDAVIMTDSDVDTTPVKKTGSYAEFYVSNRKAITEDEKKNALMLADAAANDASFKVVMRPSHVYKRFFLFLPNQWVTKSTPLRNQDVILRIGKDEWPVRFNFNSRRQFGGLTSGWKHFSISNNLEEFDVCVFEPVTNPSGPPVVLEVKIFRVVAHVVPLTRMPSNTNQMLIKAPEA